MRLLLTTRMCIHTSVPTSVHTSARMSMRMCIYMSIHIYLWRTFARDGCADGSEKILCVDACVWMRVCASVPVYTFT